jgi:hypothetical protein
MKLPGRFLQGLPRLPILAAVLGAALVGGCNTYHYYDIDVTFASPFTDEQASVMKLCEVQVSGAASDLLVLICPPMKYPNLGTFEYATFADSGSITFTLNAYYDTPPSPGNLCTSAPLTLTASDQITTSGTITATDFNATNCPLNVSGGSQ